MDYFLGAWAPRWSHQHCRQLLLLPLSLLQPTPNRRTHRVTTVLPNPLYLEAGRPFRVANTYSSFWGVPATPNVVWQTHATG